MSAGFSAGLGNEKEDFAGSAGVNVVEGVAAVALAGAVGILNKEEAAGAGAEGVVATLEDAGAAAGAGAIAGTGGGAMSWVFFACSSAAALALASSSFRRISPYSAASRSCFCIFVKLSLGPRGLSTALPAGTSPDVTRRKVPGVLGGGGNGVPGMDRRGEAGVEPKEDLSGDETLGTVLSCHNICFPAFSSGA